MSEYYNFYNNFLLIHWYHLFDDTNVFFYNYIGNNFIIFFAIAIRRFWSVATFSFRVWRCIGSVDDRLGCSALCRKSSSDLLCRKTICQQETC